MKGNPFLEVIRNELPPTTTGSTSKFAFIINVLNPFKISTTSLSFCGAAVCNQDHSSTASTISKYIDFDRILIQKSGYFARSASPNKEELEYIFKICDFAYESAIKGKSGVSGIDERQDEMQCIDFNDIKLSLIHISEPTRPY